MHRKDPCMGPYRRIVLKLSGESIGSGAKRGLDPVCLNRVASQLAGVKRKFKDAQIAIVLGGGNFIRGGRGDIKGIKKVTAHQMGMLATLINALALRDTLIGVGVGCKVLNSFDAGAIAESFSIASALRYLENGDVVILSGGTGNPFFSTDTAGVVRALEIEADAIFKATKVDGVYSNDPMKFKDAKFYERITFEEVLQKKLGVMDLAAIGLCIENRIPVLIFNIFKKDNLIKAMGGEKVGTLIY